MRISQRQVRIERAKTELAIKINEYQRDRDIEDTEMLRAISFEAREILLDMEPAVKRAYRYSDLKDVIREHTAEHEMTSIEVLQCLFSHCEGILKYMLRYERHGNYDTPAGVEA